MFHWHSQSVKLMWQGTVVWHFVLGILYNFDQFVSHVSQSNWQNEIWHPSQVTKLTDERVVCHNHPNMVILIAVGAKLMKFCACHSPWAQVMKWNFRQVCHSHTWVTNWSKLYSNRKLITASCQMSDRACECLLAFTMYIWSTAGNLGPLLLPCSDC